MFPVCLKLQNALQWTGGEREERENRIEKKCINCQ